jgi:hypothetical protein
MKMSAMLFSLLVACQALPVAMHAAAAQTVDTIKADVDNASRTFIADQFGPDRLRNEYDVAVARPKLLAGKPLAYTYDLVAETAMNLAGGNTMKSQVKTSYAYDKDGRSRSVSSLSGLERIIIADPIAHAVYLVCPERKEVLRMTGAALVSQSGNAPAWSTAGPDKSATNTDLGQKEIAGVKASGTRSETIIPAGAQGNEKPLVHTSEAWFSADLATLVYFHMTMPEFGDTVMHVENLKFGDVPASTFALPDGYAIRDIALAGNDAK